MNLVPPLDGVNDCSVVLAKQPPYLRKMPSTLATQAHTDFLSHNFVKRCAGFTTQVLERASVFLQLWIDQAFSFFV